MTIAYQISYECGEYTHTDILEVSTNYDEIERLYHQFLGECMMDVQIGNNSVDYICIETFNCEIDEDGNIDPIDDDYEVTLEYVINEPV